jgi:membrane-associated phospholipid phosphatase
MTLQLTVAAVGPAASGGAAPAFLGVGVLPLLPQILAVLVVGTVLGLFTIVGLDRLRGFRGRAAERFQTVLPYLVLLGGVLIINSMLRDIGPELSWIIGWQITDWIFAVEGTFVGWLQSFSNPAANVYFSYIYVYGYIFLMVFPIIAYLVLDDDRPIKEAALAYTINYGIGVVCYLLFIAYGPRNVMPDTVDQILYLNWPESHLLTSQINANVNVFPSLHTSLSVSVAALAYRTRSEYPRWVPVATVLAVSVMIATMYLGIHWATDVFFGVLLGLFSVGVAAWLTSPNRRDGRLWRLGQRFRRPLDRSVAALFDWIEKRRGTSG